MINIVIVGGGVSGIALLKALKEDANHLSLKSLIKITIIEKKTIGTGLAFSTNIPTHIINMPAQTMGFSKSDKSDFHKWCASKEHIQINHNSTYLARKLYGKYLEEVSEKILLNTPSSTIVSTVLKDEVQAIVREEIGFTVYCMNHAEVKADYVILAIGIENTTSYLNWENDANYIKSPWCSEKLNKIPKNDSVAILGSGLTAIDTVISLIHQGHQGKIKLFSRNGLLPRVQSTIPTPHKSSIEQKLRALLNESMSKLTFKEVFRVIITTIREESGLLDWTLHRRPSITPQQILQNDIIDSSKTLIWQQVLAQSTAVICDIWHALPHSERMLFDKHLKSLWMTNRHPMPKENALFLLNLFENKQLEVMRLCKSITDKMEFQTFKEYADCSWVINGTNVSEDITQIQSPLMKQLIESHMIHPHINGGINSDYATHEASDVFGQKTKNFFVLGQLTRGVHFYTNAVEQNISHAYNVSNAIIYNIEKQDKINKKYNQQHL
ncbi:MAG: FAD/NAD(P)-binding protein [Fluviicola sp.]|nr:FAD/NAD(P)-binding protein [Fluviicola sp.]